MAIIDMSGLKIPCEHSNWDITECYPDGYSGKRGKCLICGVGFSLE